MRRSAVRRRLNHLYKAVLPGLCLPLTNYLTSFPTSDLPEDPPQYAWATFCQDGFQCRRLWEVWQHLLWGGAPPFLTPEEPFCTCAVWEVSLASGVIDVVLLSLHSSRAQLLPLTLSLECQGKQGPIIPLDKLQLLGPGAHLPPTSLWSVPSALLTWWAVSMGDLISVGSCAVSLSSLDTTFPFSWCTPSFWWRTTSTGFLRKGAWEVNTLRPYMSENVYFILTQLYN